MGGAEAVDLASLQRFVLSLSRVHLHSTYMVNCHDRTLESGKYLQRREEQLYTHVDRGSMCAPPKKVEEKKRKRKRRSKGFSNPIKHPTFLHKI
jgi:hypothetical protein